MTANAGGGAGFNPLGCRGAVSMRGSRQDRLQCGVCPGRVAHKCLVIRLLDKNEQEGASLPLLIWLRDDEVPVVPLGDGFIRCLSRTIMIQVHLNNGLILPYILFACKKNQQIRLHNFH